MLHYCNFLYYTHTENMAVTLKVDVRLQSTKRTAIKTLYYESITEAD
jgi:hypothetical protein